MINYTKKGTNAENFMQISFLLKKIWYLIDSRNGQFAMHYSSLILTEEHQLNMLNGAHENYSKIFNECPLSISEGKLFENG